MMLNAFVTPDLVIALRIWPMLGALRRVFGLVPAAVLAFQITSSTANHSHVPFRQHRHFPICVWQFSPGIRVTSTTLT